MANDHEYRHKKNSSSSSSLSSVCEMSMLLVSNIILLSTRRLFASPSFTATNNVQPRPPQDHERLTQPHDPFSKPSKIKITQESADSITKPRSFVKPGEVGQTLTRHEINDDVDAHAGNYINQVREKINRNNHANKTASSGTSSADKRFASVRSSSSRMI